MATPTRSELRSAGVSEAGSPTQPSNFGFERYFEHQTNLSGGKRGGGANSRGGARYTEGPYSGMSPGEAYEKAREEYSGLGDDEKGLWEAEANMGDVRSGREGNPNPAPAAPPNPTGTYTGGLGDVGPDFYSPKAAPATGGAKFSAPLGGLNSDAGTPLQTGPQARAGANAAADRIGNASRGGQDLYADTNPDRAGNGGSLHMGQDAINDYFNRTSPGEGDKLASGPQDYVTGGGQHTRPVYDAASGQVRQQPIPSDQPTNPQGAIQQQSLAQDGLPSPGAPSTSAPASPSSIGTSVASGATGLNSTLRRQADNALDYSTAKPKPDDEEEEEGEGGLTDGSGAPAATAASV